MREIIYCFIYLLLSSCSMNAQTVELEGEIVMAVSDSHSDELYLYFPLIDKKLPVIQNKEVSYAGFHWANTSNNFVGIQYVKNEIGLTIKGNICLFDSTAAIVDIFIHQWKMN